LIGFAGLFYRLLKLSLPTVESDFKLYSSINLPTMYALNLSGAVLLLSAVAVGAQDLLTDITQIQRYWGQLSPYADNADNYFGVEYVGVPDGCQVVGGILSFARHPA
jgi:hypothetical protein